MAVPSGVDPHEVLGVAAGASRADVTAAYRRLAKRWHPDREPSREAVDRMALINAAYDALRAQDRPASSPAVSRDPGGRDRGAPSWPSPGSGGPSETGRGAGTPRATARPGAPPPWTVGGRSAGVEGVAAEPAVDAAPADGLAPAVRRALGPELRGALEPGELVGLVVPVTTWASPQTTLAVTDRRVLWLLDDAPVHRVRELALADVADVRVRPPRPWRRAQVVCTDRRDRRTTFGELPAGTADAVARRVRAGGGGRAVRGVRPGPVGRS